MTKRSPFRYFKTSPEVIRLAVMLYVRFPLSLRNVEDLLHERGIDVSHETVRFWWNRFGPMFAAEIRRKRVDRMRSGTHWQWHLDEVFVKINGEMHYLWRAVDQEGEVLETYVTKRRDRKAALKFLRKSMRQRRPSGNGSLVEQQGREFSFAVPTTGTGHASVQAHAKSAEIRRRPRLSPQSFQPGTSPLQQDQFQAESHRRSGRVASTWCGIRDSIIVLTETGSHWSDSTVLGAPSGRALSGEGTCDHLSDHLRHGDHMAGGHGAVVAAMVALAGPMSARRTK
jgi:transposase-like protein